MADGWEDSLVTSVLGDSDDHEALQNHSRFRLFPSLRFEYFLQLLKRAEFIIGNSSAGIREAPSYGIHALNIGTRQHNRAAHSCIHNVGYETNAIVNAIQELPSKISETIVPQFGEGRSAQLFMDVLNSSNLWDRSAQKQFRDVH